MCKICHCGLFTRCDLSDSLIGELPKIILRGKRVAQRILDDISSENRITLQTNEFVLPTKAAGGLSQYFGQSTKESHDQKWTNRMIYGDNLLVMQALLAGDPKTGLSSMRGKIDLIYIDPPFDSKADYKTKIHLPSMDLEQNPRTIQLLAYSDTWKNGTVSYLEMLVPRLILMKELLSDKGSIYIEIDGHVGHYVKIVMDELFGKENFINEIVWKRTFSHSDTKQGSKHYGRLHDNILLYSKTKEYNFTTQYLPYDKKYLDDFYKYEDENGVYRLVSMLGPGGAAKGNPIYEVMGVKRYWAFSKEKMQKMIDDGIVVQTNPGNVPQMKRYLKDMKGVPLQDIWTDIPPVQGQANENVNYATQKPEKLLERIIETSTDENSIVADFFAGSGTTGAVAEKLGRKWIMSDLGKTAFMIMRKRMVDQESKPFLYHSIGDYQKEQFEQSSFRTIGDLAQVVVNLYGALPFPAQEGNPNNLGYIKQSKTLVFVDSPSKLTGYNTLKRAQELRSSFMGGWNKVIILAWNFNPDIGRIIESLADKNLEVLVIPPDLLDKLKTKSSYEKLVKSGEIRFSSLQYLTVKPIKKKEHDKEQDVLDIELDNYILLTPDVLPLDEKNKEKLEKVIEGDPLSLVEYWSIDPNYDGEIFRSKWQEYRENNDDLRIKKSAKIIIPKIDKKFKVCIKAVDVFGFESATVKEIN